MPFLSGVDSDRESRRRRIAKLSEKLTPRLRLPGEQIYELCRDLDEAVEFAALEGESLAEAIAVFAEEGYAGGVHAGPPAKGVAELAGLAGYGSALIDMPALQLPVMPKQISRLLRTSNESTSAKEIGLIAASDPVLAGKLLGAANSALSGSALEIVSILDAVMRLGVPKARRVLLRSCLSEVFASKPLQDLWEHSQTVAHAAYDLAVFSHAFPAIDPDVAYAAGLLHDIGRLAFLKLPAKQRILEQEWLAAGFPLVYAETLAHGLDHGALGASCLRNWELPDGIVEAVELHHRSEVGGSPLSAVLGLAEDLAARAANAASEDLWPAMRRTAACFTIGITLDQFGEFCLEQVGQAALSRVGA